MSNQEKVVEKVTHHSVGFDQDYIKALKVVQHQQNSLLLVCVKQKVILFEINANGTPGSKQHEFDINGEGNIGAVDVFTDAGGNLRVLVVDSTNTLNLLNYTNKALTQKDNIVHACFAEGTILAIEMDSSKLLVLDLENVDNVLKDHDLGVEDAKSVQYLGQNSIFIFHDE